MHCMLDFHKTTCQSDSLREPPVYALRRLEAGDLPGYAIQRPAFLDGGVDPRVITIR